MTSSLPVIPTSEMTLTVWRRPFLIVARSSRIWAKLTTLAAWRVPFPVMARLVRATSRGTVLVQVARTNRAMTRGGGPPGHPD